MKNIDLKQMGVQEMDAVEILETNGGFLLALASGYAVMMLYETMNNPQDVIDGFIDALT